MSQYAPVVVFTYNRCEHTEDLLNSLAACVLAKESDLVIFSDGPKREEHKESVSNVRKLINDPKWEGLFNSVRVIESKVNKGLANSIITGVTDVINEYNKVIVLEDDLVVAPQYLTFMNDALSAYENDDTKFAIAGWSYPIKALKDYEKDAWLFYRACSWGWGTWKNRWDKVIFDPDEAGFSQKLSDEYWVKKFCRGGNDLPGMLEMQLEGKRDSWAIRWNAWASQLDMMTVYPKDSLIVNNGRDGSGVHAHEGQQDYSASLRGEGVAYDFAKAKEKYIFDGIEIDEKLIKQAWLFDSDTLTKKVKRNLKTIFVDHKVPDVVKKAILKVKR